MTIRVVHVSDKVVEVKPGMKSRYEDRNCCLAPQNFNTFVSPCAVHCGSGELGVSHCVVFPADLWTVERCRSLFHIGQKRFLLLKTSTGWMSVSSACTFKSMDPTAPSPTKGPVTNRKHLMFFFYSCGNFSNILSQIDECTSPTWTVSISSSPAV